MKKIKYLTLLVLMAAIISPLLINANASNMYESSGYHMIIFEDILVGANSYTYKTTYNQVSTNVCSEVTVNGARSTNCGYTKSFVSKQGTNASHSHDYWRNS